MISDPDNILLEMKSDVQRRQSSSKKLCPLYTFQCQQVTLPMQSDGSHLHHKIYEHNCLNVAFNMSSANFHLTKSQNTQRLCRHVCTNFV